MCSILEQSEPVGPEYDRCSQAEEDDSQYQSAAAPHAGPAFIAKPFLQPVKQFIQQK